MKALNVLVELVQNICGYSFAFALLLFMHYCLWKAVIGIAEFFFGK